MNCLIVDDEPLAAELIRSYIERVDGLVAVKICLNAIDALHTLRQYPVDLIFLDVEMPKISGIEFLKSLPARPKVIFTTAYRDFAFEAFDLDVIDYLLKPVSFERFLRSVGKVYPFKLPEQEKDQLNIKHDFNESYIFLRSEKEMVKVFLRDIIYIESLRDYVRVKTMVKELISYNRISYLEQKLPENKFLHVHRSFIVATDRIMSYTASSIKLNHYTIPLGRNYKNSVSGILNRYNILFESQ